MHNALIVNLIGGLGNQLFQYMFGTVLFDITGRDVKYDIGDFDSYHLHDGPVIPRYFDVGLTLVTDPPCVPLPWYLRTYKRKRIVSRLVSRTSLAGIRDLLHVHTDRTFSLSNPLTLDERFNYFHGYWQTQPYSCVHLEQFCRGLKFRREIEGEANSMIRSSNMDLTRSAAIHVRRGDYVTAPNRAPQYPLSLDYYRNAMGALKNNEGIERFYIFSDDPAWIQSQFSEDNSVISLKSKTAGLDLCLMSQFRNIIVSNSTFAWWGAALRRDKAGMVLYPLRWTKRSTALQVGITVPKDVGWIGL